MKKILLSTLCIFSMYLVKAQTYNNCTDASASATIVADVTYSVGDIDGDEPPIFCEGTGSNVDFGEWVKYIPNDDYLVTVSSDLSQNGDKDTRVQVFQANCQTGEFSCVGGDDDSGVYGGTNSNSYLSVAEFDVLAGEAYYIVWDDKWNSGHNFDFILTEGDPSPPPPYSLLRLHKRLLTQLDLMIKL